MYIIYNKNIMNKNYLTFNNNNNKMEYHIL